MANNRVQVFFVNAERYGWTEQHWWTGANDFATLKAAIDPLIQARAAFLTKDCSIPRVRVSTGTKRLPVILDYETVPFAGGGFQETVNSSDDAVIIKFSNTSVGYNRVFLRGIPDSMVAGDQFNPTPPYLDLLQAWINVLGGSSWAIVSHLGNQQPSVQAVSAAQNFPKGILLTLPGGTTLNPGDVVRISGSSIFGYNGYKNVVSVTGAQAILGGARPPADPPASDTIFVTPIKPMPGPIQITNLEQFTLRKPGRPFGLRRGRARTSLSLRP